MCGIVGYIGHQDALPIIIGGLEKLEYRGYDSAGVAVFEEGKIKVTRALGKLSELKKSLEASGRKTKAHLGIGHTRWATHGKPSENNAHPHTAGRVSLIHNGIVENYVELREELEKEGRKFSSETDTEIAAHLLDRHLQDGQNPFQALKATCAEIRGSYAFLAIDSEHSDRILVAKNATPIVIGFGKDEVMIASDIPAVLALTRQVIILEDGDIAEVKSDSIYVENSGKEVKRLPKTITWDPVTAQKGGYKHYMLKEIHEQGEVVTNTFRGRVELENPRVVLRELSLGERDISKINRAVIVACGSAWHAGLIAKFYIEALSGVPCEVDYASEFRYRHQVFDEHTLVMAVTQSGETADTLAAIELAGSKAKTLAICNVLGSSITRKVKDVLYTHAGPEISVASTKAFTAQLVAGYLLGVYFGQAKGTLSTDRVATLVEDLLKVPAAIDEALKTSDQIREVAKTFKNSRDALFLGRGISYPIALEGALKLKEISYIHAEGYPAGEMKHGPIALIDEQMPVVVLLQKSEIVFEKALSNLKEVESRGGKIIAFTDTKGQKELQKTAKHLVEVPHISELLSPLILNIPSQLLAYHVADQRGTDVDLPRNLAKSVTVE